MNGSVSIIIPAYGHCPHLPDLVSALAHGTVSPLEIIVSHSGSSDPTPLLSAFHGSVRVLHQEERLLGGAARNRGAAIASGNWLAFIDADVLPQQDWLEVLLRCLATRTDTFVVGSVGYAASGGYWGLCNWICEFSEQFPWHQARCQTGGASCNMIVCAADFHAAGGFPEDYQPGEDTVLFYRLIQLGRNQWFEPAARVNHFNQAGFLRFAQHQFKLGYHSAVIRQQIPLRGSVATRIWPLALALWMPRLALISRRLVAGSPWWWIQGFVLLPGLLVGTWIWTAGFLKRVLSHP